jgi:hypothetical protein
VALVIGLIVLVVTVWAWRQFGVLAGIAAGVLTFPVLSLIVGGIGLLIPGRRNRQEFIRAFEERGGRMGLERGATNVEANRLYWLWRKEGGDLSAAEWLEKQGLHAPPGPGEVRITSSWEYGVIRRPDDRFVAARWFQYEIGGPLGSVTGWTHRDYCAHLHETEEQARPCLRDLKMSGDPTIEDLERRATSGVPWRVGRVPPASEGHEIVSGTTGPLTEGLRFGNSVIPWSDVERVSWGLGTVRFWLKPGLFSDSDGGPVSVHAIDVIDLGDAEKAWTEFIGSLHLEIPMERNQERDG